MGILNYLPEFKVIEINRSTGLVMGHVLSQYLNGTDLAFTTKNTVDFLENGVIVGLSNDLTIEEFSATKHAQPFVVFNEEINTIFTGLKYFASEVDEDGEVYPRAIGLYIGDTFTTDNFSGTLATASAAKVVDGILTLQLVPDDDSLFIVEASTLPTGGDAGRFTYMGFNTGRVDEWEITYDLNGGNIELSEDDVVLTVNSNVSFIDGYTSALPVYTGYELLATVWAYDDAGVSPAGNDFPVANDTVYADWAPVEYTITYNLDDGVNDAGNPATYNIETTTITLADATKELYTFGGWYTEAELTNPVTEIAIGSTGDVELFAKFTLA